MPGYDYNHTHQCACCTEEFNCPLTDQECIDANEPDICDDCAADLNDDLLDENGTRTKEDD